MDQIGAEVTGFALGDRMFGGAMSRAVAYYVVVNPSQDEVLPIRTVWKTLPPPRSPWLIAQRYGILMTI